jgi:hypothetical protein
MDPAERLVDEANTLVPATQVLRSMGYRSRLEQDAAEMRWAESDGIQFGAEDPLRLLGGVTMRTARGASWRPAEGEVESVLRECHPDVVSD